MKWNEIEKILIKWEKKRIIWNKKKKKRCGNKIEKSEKKEKKEKKERKKERKKKYEQIRYLQKLMASSS